MSFLKITNPAKRDFIVEEFLKTKKNIQQNYLSEKLGDIGLQRELKKIYKPITDTQETIKENLSALPSALIKALPATKAIQFPQYPSIEAYSSEDPVEDIKTLELGETAAKYLKQHVSSKKSTDTTFGINYKDGQFYVGDTAITIQGDDVTVGDKTYIGTPGLWELLTMKEPDDSIWSKNDYDNYASILDETNAMRRVDNPSKPKASRSRKYKNIIKPIWKEKTGKGVIILPSDPNALLDMLSLRMASLKAGNTGVRNEIVSICDELLRQQVIDKDQYKNIFKNI